ncbi:MAG: hypothetical protein WBZ36_15060 [Candidatus Nitrosopolaris sp.]
MSIYKTSQRNKTASKNILYVAFDSDYIKFRTELRLVHIDEFIEKPILFEDFIRTVRRHINN